MTPSTKKCKDKHLACLVLDSFINTVSYVMFHLTIGNNKSPSPWGQKQLPSPPRPDKVFLVDWGKM